MTRTISKAKLKAMQARGVKTSNNSPEPPTPKPPPPAESTPEVARALAQHAEVSQAALRGQDIAMRSLAESLGQGSMMLAEKLESMVLHNQESTKEPVPYRFEVKRDRQGLIEHIDAYPIVGE